MVQVLCGCWHGKTTVVFPVTVALFSLTFMQYGRGGHPEVHRPIAHLLLTIFDVLSSADGFYTRCSLHMHTHLMYNVQTQVHALLV